MKARPLPSTPIASSPATRRAMQGNRSSNTKPEVELRRALHRAGYRFRTDSQIEEGSLKVRPDIVLRSRRTAIFLDGCFWHGCPNHCRMPVSNRDYWEAKIGRNVERDRLVTTELEAVGWNVVRVWEHESVEKAASRVVEKLTPPKAGP